MGNPPGSEAISVSVKISTPRVKRGARAFLTVKTSPRAFLEVVTKPGGLITRIIQSKRPIGTDITEPGQWADSVQEADGTIKPSPKIIGQADDAGKTILTWAVGPGISAGSYLITVNASLPGPDSPPSSGTASVSLTVR